MPKAGEISYLQMLGEIGVAAAMNKPYSDPDCARHLISLGTIRTLLPDPPARLLDLGCGTGWTSCMFAQMGFDVVGQDIAPDMIHYANVNKQRRQITNARFVVCDYESMHFEDEFDCALFYDSLHHAEDEKLALQMVHLALRDGGTCVTHEPGKGHAEAETSRHAAHAYGVTEKDMPPYHIMALARKIGFSRQCYLPFPEGIVREVTLPAHRACRQPPAPWRKRFGRRFRDAWNRTRALNRQLAKSKRNGGLVLLVK